MDYEFQENNLKSEKLRNELELPESIELIERSEQPEPAEFNTETIKLSDGTEIDSRTKKETQENKEISPFIYSKDYVNADGVYIPSQIKGVYTDAAEDSSYKDTIKDLGRWELQQQSFSCAVQVQKWIISEETGYHISERELRETGINNGLYDENAGTYLQDIGKLAEMNGLSYEQYSDLTTDELVALKNTGANLIVCVDSHLLNRPDLNKESKVNHAVEVIGFDFSDKKNPLVIINDPGSSRGRGVAYPMEIFERAACRVDENTGKKTIHFATAVYGRGENNDG